MGMVPHQSLELNVSTHPMAVDGNVGGEWRGSLDPLREEIIAWLVDLVGVEVIIQAKEEFFIQTGKVFHDDENYHRRMSYFLDYFIFVRSLPALSPPHNLTPFELYRQSHSQLLVQHFTHSLFKVQKIHSTGLMIQDLCSNEKLRIQKQSDELFDGVTKNDVFQGSIFKLENNLILSHGLIFHPARSHRLLAKMIKESKKQGTFIQFDFLARSARLQLKQSRLRHVDPRLVYADLRV